MPRKILAVCLGNICRSPAAEGVLRALLPGEEIDSAGTSDWHIGDPPYGPMIAAARARGYDIAAFRARQFRAADFGRFDLILAMDAKNLADIEALRPSGSTTEVRLFAPFAGTGETEVPDPYYTRDFDGALMLIERAGAGLRAALASQPD